MLTGYYRFYSVNFSGYFQLGNNVPLDLAHVLASIAMSRLAVKILALIISIYFIDLY